MEINLKWIAYPSIVLAILLTLWFLIFGEFWAGDYKDPDFEKIRNLQPFISGIAVPLITFATSLLIIETFKNTTLQNISNNFFKLIDQNKKLLEGVNCDSSHLLEKDFKDIKSKGKDFFDDLCERIAEDYNAISQNNAKYLSKMDQKLKIKTKNKEGKELLIEIYDYYYHVHQSDLGHYFRNLYHIVRYIHKCKIRMVRKKEFLKILRSQLSNYEMLLLAYNGLHPYGEKFYKYIEDYELLKGTNNETRLSDSYSKRIIDIEILQKAYPHLKKYWHENK